MPRQAKCSKGLIWEGELTKVDAYGVEPERAKMAAKPPIFASNVKKA